MQQPAGGYYAAPYVSYAQAAPVQQPVYAAQPSDPRTYQPPYSPVHGANLGYDAAPAPPTQAMAPQMYGGGPPPPSYGSMASAGGAYGSPPGGQLRYAGGAVVGGGQPMYAAAPPGGAPGLRPALSFRSEYSHASAASYGAYSAYPQQGGAGGGRYVTSADAQGYAQPSNGTQRSSSVPVSPSRVSTQLQTQRERTAAHARRRAKPVRDRFGYKPKQEVDKVCAALLACATHVVACRANARATAPHPHLRFVVPRPAPSPLPHRRRR